MECLKRLYGRAVIDNSDSEEIKEDCRLELEYYRLKSKTTGKPYGIEIVKKNIQDNQINIEKKKIYNISYKEENTNRLLDIMINNKVTPVSVEDIIHDLTIIKVI